MKKIAVCTDSNSGFSPEEAKAAGVYVLPMPFYINNELYFQDIDLTIDDFYQRLSDNEDIKTSMPLTGDLLAFWDKILEEYEELVYSPMSSGLSSSCAAAESFAPEYGGRVHVVDNRRISASLKQSVFDALDLAQQGKTGEEIKAELEAAASDGMIYITMDSLHYLKKGGRLTPAVAAIGTLLNIKPVLLIDGAKLDVYKKVRGKAAAKDVMIQAVKDTIATKFKGLSPEKDLLLYGVYSQYNEEAKEWNARLQQEFPGIPFAHEPLSLSIACHIGPGAVAVVVLKRFGR